MRRCTPKALRVPLLSPRSAKPTFSFSTTNLAPMDPYFRSTFWNLYLLFTCSFHTLRMCLACYAHVRHMRCAHGASASHALRMSLARASHVAHMCYACVAHVLRVRFAWAAHVLHMWFLRCFACASHVIHMWFTRGSLLVILCVRFGSPSIHLRLTRCSCVCVALFTCRLVFV